MMKKTSLMLVIGITFFLNVQNVFAQYGMAEAGPDKMGDARETTEEALLEQEILRLKSVNPEPTKDLESWNIVDPEASLSAGEEKQPMKTVKAIDIAGNKTIGVSTILARIKTRVGDPYLAHVVSDDIKRLYGLGYFSDIMVEREDLEDGVKVRIHLTEKPIIEEITFSKIRHYNPRTLLLRVKSQKGHFFDNRVVNEDVRTIRDLYARKGLTDAVIESTIEADQETNKIKVHFEITEGERVKIQRIALDGNKAFSYKRILRVMKTRADSLFTSGFLKQEIVDEDMDRIKDFYVNQGFLDVTANYLYEKAPRSRLILRIHIKEGERYYVGNISVSGNDIVFSDEEILKSLKELKQEKIFNPRKLEKDIAEIRSLYFDKGYIFCRVRDSVAINLQTGKVDILLNLTEGEIAYVNKIHVQGNTRTRDIVIRRELRLQPGEAFDGGKLRRSKERLSNLGFFEEIDYDIKDTQESNQKDLIVQVKEAKTGSFSFGGGYSTVDRFIGFAEIQQKNFDFMNWPTFAGGGQDLLVRAEIGSVRNNARLSFTEPWLFDYPISGGFDVYRNSIDQDSNSGYAYSEKRVGGNLRLGKQFGEYLSGGTIYRMEEITIGNVVPSASQDLKDEQGKNTISSLSFNLAQDTRDSVFSPTRGLVLGGTADVAGGFLGGDKDFYRLQGRGNYFVPLFFNTVLEFRVRIGFADAYGDSKQVPIYERFFAGGAYTIRGYNERKVGPLDPDSKDPIGGESLFVGNIEYTVPIVDFIKVATFFDIGNVWRYREDFGKGGYKAGMGLGLRIKTPLGPINLDYGYPLHDEPGEDKRSGKFYFSISRSF